MFTGRYIPIQLFSVWIYILRCIFRLGCVFEAPGEPPEYQPVLWHHSGTSICRFHFCAYCASLGGHELHWIKTKTHSRCQADKLLYFKPTCNHCSISNKM
ncbi:hypothetical protein JTE90_019177 [Oedothorax gibbosus]|uniref:Secreted protein n=1 Tax=Oedothorax gibbosus TaxID=931172 RepID=A0AAV6UU55_9ARAC|nr:hypothetical protein JTE90_019177 [Oedothorax gibbosus]